MRQRKYPKEFYQKALELHAQGFGYHKIARMVGFRSSTPVRYLFRKEQIQLRNQIWRNNNQNKDLTYRKEYIKKYRKLFPERVKLSNRLALKKYRSNQTNFVKDKARVFLYTRIRSGKIKRGICFCGEKKVEGHHEDYSKPLEVIWLCRKHHREKHRKLSTG
jgi:hypothetical protein